MEIFRWTQASARLPCPADNYLAITTRLLTLTDHPGLDLIIVLNRVSDRADRCHSPSGLVMEIPRFHKKNARIRMNAVRPMPVPQLSSRAGRVFDRIGRADRRAAYCGRACRIQRAGPGMRAATKQFEARAKIDPIRQLSAGYGLWIAPNRRHGPSSNPRSRGNS